MTRYRWYRINVPSKNSLSSHLKEYPLTKKSEFGFLCVDEPLQKNKFLFLMREKLFVTTFDEDGNSKVNEVDNLSVTKLSIINVNKTEFIRIEDPGRNSKDLFNVLESILGFGFTSNLITFDDPRSMSIFENVQVSKILGLKIAGAVVDSDLIARMEFVSKQGMKIERIPPLRGLNYKVDSLTFEVLIEGVKGNVSISSNGLVKVSGQLSPKIVSLIEDDLVAIK